METEAARDFEQISSSDLEVWCDSDSIGVYVTSLWYLLLLCSWVGVAGVRNLLVGMGVSSICDCSAMPLCLEQAAQERLNACIEDTKSHQGDLDALRKLSASVAESGVQVNPYARFQPDVCSSPIPFLDIFPLVRNAGVAPSGVV